LNFLKRLEMAARLAFSNSSWDDFIRAWLSGEDHPLINGNLYVNTETAMKYSAVFACVRVLSETLAGVPLMVYRKTPAGDREAVTNHPVYDILHNRPNDEMSPFNFKESCMSALNLGGNSVSEKLLSSNGTLVGLYPYQWDRVDIKRDHETNRLQYRITSGSTRTGGRIVSKTLDRSKVFHITGLSLDGIVGMSPIEYAASGIRLGLSYEQFGVQFYKNGMNPSIGLEYPNELSDKAYTRLKDDLAKNYGGLLNTGKPFLAEGGAKIKELTIKPADAQLLESKRFQVEDICRIYRVPLHLVQNLDRATNNNIEHQSLEFVMYTMLPWFKRWEENINAQLLSPTDRRYGLYAEFKVDSLLRGDAKSRAEAYAAGRQWGWLSVNDIRRLENMNGIGPAGDIYLQPANMIEAGKEQQASAAYARLVEDIYKMITERGNVA
jgi:HK97 family phage portal protein